MRRRISFPPVAAAFLALVVAIAIWAVLDARKLQGRVARGVSIAGHDAGGMTPQQLDALIEEIEQEHRATPVNVATFDGGFTTSAGEFGLEVDRDSLRLAALTARRPTNLGRRVSEYLGSFVSTHDLPVPVRTSADRTAAMLSQNEGAKRRDPVDPQLRVRNGEFSVLPGSDGEGIDAEVLAAQLPEVVAAGKRPWVLFANRVPLPSRFTNEELARLIEQAAEKTSRGLLIATEGEVTKISSARVRSWVSPRIVDRRLELRLDKEATLEGLTKALEPLLKDPVDASYDISDSGSLSINPSQDGKSCCAPDSVARLERALAAGSTEEVPIALEVARPRRTTDDLQSYKVLEPVATFTTRHRAGESRVKNIHRIADMLRGQIIAPGETLSVNKVVGKRTPENGFVEAKVIEYGVFVESFGGGISQFATTLFNAAFFAGLDIPEHQPHSIYIDRYPYGREATLSWPKPDLKIRNTTPYGILVWPTYTASTITVTLYSSPYAKVEANEPKESTQNECKVVLTERVRTFPDGETKTDKFRAVYLPKEGVKCDGTPTPGATTTTLKPVETRPPRTTVDDAGDGPSGDGSDVPASTRSPQSESTRATRVDTPPITRVQLDPAPTPPAPVPVAQPTPDPAPPAPAPDPQPAPVPAAPQPEPPAPAPAAPPVNVAPPITSVITQ